MIRAARAHARTTAWAAGAAATWKQTFGFHPLLVFLDRPDIAAGEALAGLLRKGNAGSNTTADHISVLEQALRRCRRTTAPTRTIRTPPRC